MAIPGFQELFESRINNYFYVPFDSYIATRLKTILFPSTYADVQFWYLFAFKNGYQDYVVCYVTYQSKSPHVLCHVFSRRARFGFFRIQS